MPVLTLRRHMRTFVHIKPQKCTGRKKCHCIFVSGWSEYRTYEYKGTRQAYTKNISWCAVLNKYIIFSCKILVCVLSFALTLTSEHYFKNNSHDILLHEEFHRLFIQLQKILPMIFCCKCTNSFVTYVIIIIF